MYRWDRDSGLGRLQRTGSGPAVRGLAFAQQFFSFVKHLAGRQVPEITGLHLKFNGFPEIEFGKTKHLATNRLRNSSNATGISVYGQNFRTNLVKANG